MGASDAGFEHSAAPVGDFLHRTYIMNFQSLGESANAADFYVNDAARSGFAGEGGAARVDDRLVQANRSTQLLLQPRVIVDVVVPQRLLNHQKIELIELSQVFHLIQRVGGICVAAEDDFRPARAYPFEYVHVPTGLDFDLNATVPRGQFVLDFFQQLLD